VVVLAGATAFLIGVPLGALAGYAGGWTDRLLSRLVEVVAAFPAFLLVLAIMAWHGPDTLLLGVLLGATRWVPLFRFSRAEYLRLKEQDFVLAARALGLGPVRIAVSEILPNALAPLLVSLAFLLSGTVLLEAGLSWIGLGVGGNTPSWGHMLQNAHAHLTSAPGLLLPPASALFLMVLAWNLAGEALGRRLDVRRL
jgi:ABC-type dipeptide/oligopeptide/nickel transport system permease subunit